jgi:hypothetical protein
MVTARETVRAPGGDELEPGDEDHTGQPRLTVARVKLRKFVKDFGAPVAVKMTDISRSTLLALRAGTAGDPKCSLVLKLQRHAKIQPVDWMTCQRCKRELSDCVCRVDDPGF